MESGVSPLLRPYLSLCIIVRESSADKESLDCMIKQINSTALKREEVLENHAYLYDRERKKIMY